MTEIKRNSVNHTRLPVRGFPIRLSTSGQQSYTGDRVEYTGLFEMIVGVLTTCHTQYTSDSSICCFFI